MYEEKQRFSLKDLVLQLLFIVLFVFILVWLFPTKDSLKNMNFGNNNSGNSNESAFNFDVLTNRIFNDNIQTMKNAAKDYYTTPRLPEKVGQSVKMTLGEMLKKNLLIEFTDANGKTCDHDESYVELTKYDNEYRMKVNLKCTDNDAYIIAYMGCYDYCNSDVCERKDAPQPKPVNNTPSTPTKNPTPEPKPCTTCTNTVVNNNINVTTNINSTTNITNNTTIYVPKPTEPEKPKPEEPTPVTPIYACEYQKVTNGYYTAWSNWSNWVEEEHKSSTLKQVDVKTETVKKTVKTLLGYKTTTYEDKSKPIYTAVQVQTGTVEKTVCAEYKTTSVGTGKYTYEWVFAGTDKYYATPVPTDTEKYFLVSDPNTESCGDCSNANFEYYQKYVLKITEVMETKQECARYETKQVPEYSTVNKITGYETYQVKTGIYGYKEEQVETKFYRYRTRELVKGTIFKKWSVCDDNDLINNGYTFTGNRKQVN